MLPVSLESLTDHPPQSCYTPSSAASLAWCHIWEATERRASRQPADLSAIDHFQFNYVFTGSRTHSNLLETGAKLYFFPPRKQTPEVAEQRQWGRTRDTGTEELQMETRGYKRLRILLKCKTSLNIHFLRVSPAEGGEWGSAGESKWSRLLEFTIFRNVIWSTGVMWSYGKKWARKKKNHF